MPVEIVVRDSPTALLDEPFAVRARADGADVTWRARYKDDDGRVWKAVGATPEQLVTSWGPSKPGTGPLAALQSLRPLAIDIRAEAPDGTAATRTLTRLLRAPAVKSRRWRDGGLAATLHLPADPTGAPPVVLTVGDDAEVAALAAPLLASRGLLVLALTEGDPDAAAERLAAVPSASGAPRVLHATPDVPLPPNVGTREPAAESRITAWVELLERLGARPRRPEGLAP